METNIISRVREWMSTGLGRWVAVAAVLAILGAAAATFLRDRTRADADAIRAKGHKVLYYCKSCQQTGQMHIGWDDKFPQECPKCGKTAAVLGFKCIKCRNIIESRKVQSFRCPRCGYAYYSIFAGQDPLAPSPKK